MLDTYGSAACLSPAATKPQPRPALPPRSTPPHPLPVPICIRGARGLEAKRPQDRTTGHRATTEPTASTPSRLSHTLGTLEKKGVSACEKAHIDGTVELGILGSATGRAPRVRDLKNAGYYRHGLTTQERVMKTVRCIATARATRPYGVTAAVPQECDWPRMIHLVRCLLSPINAMPAKTFPIDCPGRLGISAFCAAHQQPTCLM